MFCPICEALMVESFDIYNNTSYVCINCGYDDKTKTDNEDSGDE